MGSWEAMWNSGIGHGFLMGLGWLLALLLLGVIVYVAVRLALRRTTLQLERYVEDALAGRKRRHPPEK